MAGYNAFVSRLRQQAHLVEVKKLFWSQIRANGYNLPLLVSKVKAWEVGKRVHGRQDGTGT